MTVQLYRFFGPGDEPLDCLVKRLCPGGSFRRRVKPVTGWLSQSDASLKEQTLYWTKEGLIRYIQSGLLGWQCSVVQDEIWVDEFELVTKPGYQDQHQVIANETSARRTKRWELVRLLETFGFQNIKDKLVFYITRKPYGTSDEELMVLKKEQTPGQPVIVPTTEFPHQWHFPEAKPSFDHLPGDVDRSSPLRKVGAAVSYDFYSKQFEAVQYFHGNSSPSASQSCSWVPVKKARQELSHLDARKLDQLHS